jgi:hypothetical protein
VPCSTACETFRAPSAKSCPDCRQRGRRVERFTMEHLLHADLVPQIANTQYYFCETANCPNVYFPYHSGGRVFGKPDLIVRVGLKETADPVPLCYCFDITRKRVWDEIERTGRSAVPEAIKSEVQAGNCACEVKNPSGKCCLGNVVRTVRQRMQAAETMEKQNI